MKNKNSLLNQGKKKCTSSDPFIILLGIYSTAMHKHKSRDMYFKSYSGIVHTKQNSIGKMSNSYSDIRIGEKSPLIFLRNKC